MGVRKIDVEACSGCKTCYDHCPMDVFRFDENKKKAYINYLRDCQGCFLCEIECPAGAITCVPIFERGVTRAW